MSRSGLWVSTCVGVCVASAAPSFAQPSAFTDHHPRLVFTRSEIPALRAKIRDGGPDDEAYAFIRDLVLTEYPTQNLAQLLGVTFGMNFLLNAGLVAQLDETEAAIARDIGRSHTLALVDSLAADDNTFYAPVRLRALCFGYDMCMDDATDSERTLVRTEIESYIDSLMFAFNYERWLHPPYASNITSMIGASLGLAAICLADEIEPARVDAALARADLFVSTWMHYQLDRDGACFEGVQYGTWSMRHLPWYFEARRRYDGKDYSRIDAIRHIERWLAYEILPEPGARVNNLNDTAYLNQPISRHNTFVDWALTRWSSGLSAWTWERTLGHDDGYDWGALADKASTVVWYRPTPTVQPGDVLPPAFLWRDRGLYYYRTGWPRRGGSDDVVFSFYSGPFPGGHSQEDQNSFTLYGHGARLSADNGFDAPNAQSEAHNMVFIDGKGQHYSRGSVGTDGSIAAHVLSNYADYLFGDATAAYTTHSDYNRPGFPFPDDDWSYGYDGGNPVERAHREWIVVHEGATPPYFVLLDDVKKDAALHTYDWRMHTDASHALDLSASPLRVESARGRLLIDVCYPALDTMQVSTTNYDNVSADPDTKVLVLSQHAARGTYALVLRPEGAGTATAVARSVAFAWGGTTVLDWPGGVTDLVLANVSEDTVSSSEAISLSTDARLAQFRIRDGVVHNYAIASVTTCDAGGIPLVRIHDGAARVVRSGTTIHLDRAASFTLHAPDVTSVRVGGESVAVLRDGAFLTNRGAPGNLPHPLRMAVYPQPASVSATIEVDTPGPDLILEVYDVAGRRVRTLWDGPVVPGRTPFQWDGREKNLRTVGSGVYFVRAQSGGATTTAKVVFVR